MIAVLRLSFKAFLYIIIIIVGVCETRLYRRLHSEKLTNHKKTFWSRRHLATVL
nr:MAG TPA: hypothetical protein [Caudoviricetes sp.]